MRSILVAASAATLFAGHALAAPETVIYPFAGGADGGFPQAGLIADANGNFYGTTTSDGAGHNGVVFELSPPPAGKTQWTETVLYAFTGGKDGGDPQARLVMDAKGDLFGTAYQGGKDGQGTVFELKPPKKGETAWTFSLVHSFTGKDDGGAPWSTLILDNAGNLYGTASQGGTGVVGVVFEFTKNTDKAGWTETVLYNFTGNNDGGEPYGNLVVGPDGALYGTAVAYGANNYGTLYRLVPSDSGNGYSFDLLYAFAGGKDGSTPRDGMILGNDGNFYGTTAGFDNSQGTVFRLSNNNGTFTETPLYAFSGAGFTGNGPWATVSQDSSGKLYGTTLGVGRSSNGEVFQLTPPKTGNHWSASVLHAFKGGTDGQFPHSTVLIGADGALFGTAEGTAGQSGFFPGTVWKITH